MGRPVVLGNGRLTVGLDEKGHVHDFYYPYVGLDNLTTARSMHHRIGISVDDEFSWTDDEAWVSEVDFSADALISQVTIRHERLGIVLNSHDFVDHEHDVLCRVLTIQNELDHARTVRLFMHQVFEISRAGRADTAVYEPEGNYILDYKGRTCLLISGEHENGEAFDQFAVGNYGIEGKKGTYMDAEDGELSGHPVEHGGVDSVIRFTCDLEPKSSSRVNYWIIAADSQFSCEETHQIYLSGVKSRLEATKAYWQHWLSPARRQIDSLPASSQTLVQKSLMVIKAHTDVRGGVIASCDSSIYNYGRDYYSYVWPRDGSYAIWPLIRLGYQEEPKAFFRFCADILTHQGFLMHKYQPDRAIGSTWHPLLHGRKRELAIQEDETAIVIIMMGEYLEYSKDEDFVRHMFDRFVVRAANFLSGFIDESTGLPHATYDLWEEKFLTSTYTTATVYRALKVAADLAARFGHEAHKDNWEATANYLLEQRSTFNDPDRGTLRKGFRLEDDGSLAFDNTVDASSLYAVMTFGYFKKEELSEFRETAERMIERLLNKSPSGGAPRYEYDNYFSTSDDVLGNPWIVTTMWFAQYYIRLHSYAKALELVEWAEKHALSSGVMPEQVHPISGGAVSVTPLVWSHAEYINTVLDLKDKVKSQP